jgi:peroxiredoxin Q/BCP
LRHRDRAAGYEAAGAVVVGVSPDPVDAIMEFHGGQSLNFTGDEDHSVSERYGVWVEQNMYGKKRWGVERSTYIVDGDGTAAKALPKVSPKTHDDVVLDALAA